MLSDSRGGEYGLIQMCCWFVWRIFLRHAGCTMQWLLCWWHRKI